MNTTPIRRFAVVVLTPLLVVTAARAQAPQTKLPGVAEKLQPFIGQNEITGAVTEVVTKDKVIHREAIGLMDREVNKPMTDDALFWIASMTKPITGTAILILQEEG